MRWFAIFYGRNWQENNKNCTPLFIVFRHKKLYKLYENVCNICQKKIYKDLHFLPEKLYNNTYV